MTRWLVEFGYDGRPFAGWARQPGLRTLEGELRSGFVRCGIARSEAEARLEVASRTDRGVSARANVLGVSSELPGSSLVRALNSVAPEILCGAATPIPDSFPVRSALWREYRYFLPAGTLGFESSAQSLVEFTRRPIDVRSFARGVPSDRPCLREIQELELMRSSRTTVLRIRARSFLWGMVRKIVAALGQVGRGELSKEALVRALEGSARLSIPLAPPEPLILWKVRYAVPWTVPAPPRSDRQRSYFSGETESARVRSRLLPLIGPARRVS